MTMGKVDGNESQRGSPVIVLSLMTILISFVFCGLNTGGVIIGTAVVEGTVTDDGASPLENVVVEVVGMEEYNTTTGPDGGYLLVVPFLEVGHSLRYTLDDHMPREEVTGTLVEDATVTVNVTMELLPPFGTLHVRILPVDQPGSNYGLRQDMITVVNASGTPRFEWSERSSEEDAYVPAPGTYLVTGTRPGYYPVTVMASIERGKRVDVDVQMSGHKKPTYGTVAGSVRFQGLPVENATVVAVPDEGTRDYEAVTNEEGIYEFQLPSGNYTVSVVASGFAKISEGVLVLLGEERTVDFPMSVAKKTGDEGNAMMGWAATIGTVSALVAVMGYAMVTSRRTAREEEAEAHRREQLECPSCGATAEADDESCNECGSAFPWKSFRCPDCGAVMDLDATRCPDCGNETFDLHRG